MVTLEDIQNAHTTIKDSIHYTPLIRSSELSRISHNEVALKSEHLQKTGSFKIRGAMNKVTQAVKDGATSVTAASSGNHGQAVAYAASKHGVPATIVVPEDAPLSKVNAIRSYNGQVITCGTTSVERIPRAQEIAETDAGVYIPPYDDPYIIAGQATVGMEILEQMEAVDIVCVPVGGGGLLSGIASAIKQTKPDVQVIGVEPEIANDTYLSFQEGSMMSIEETATIADGLRTNQPGDLTFPIVKEYVDEMVLVSEKEIKSALLFALERMKQVIEPSGVVALAGVMFDKLAVRDKNIICIASGGNMDIKKVGHLIV